MVLHDIKEGASLPVRGIPYLIGLADGVLLPNSIRIFMKSQRGDRSGGRGTTELRCYR